MTPTDGPRQAPRRWRPRQLRLVGVSPPSSPRARASGPSTSRGSPPYRVLFGARARRLDGALPRLRVGRAAARRASLSLPLLGLRVGRAALAAARCTRSSGASSASALAVAAGLAFRVTAPLFAAGLTYIQLIDVSTYLNHYYLAGAPRVAPRALAREPRVVRRRVAAPRGAAAHGPRDRSDGLARLFRVQIGVVYVVRGPREGAGRLAAARPAARHLARREHGPADPRHALHAATACRSR